MPRWTQYRAQCLVLPGRLSQEPSAVFSPKRLVGSSGARPATLAANHACTLHACNLAWLRFLTYAVPVRRPSTCTEGKKRLIHETPYQESCLQTLACMHGPHWPHCPLSALRFRLCRPPEQRRESSLESQPPESAFVHGYIEILASLLLPFPSAVAMNKDGLVKGPKNTKQTQNPRKHITSPCCAR